MVCLSILRNRCWFPLVTKVSISQFTHWSLSSAGSYLAFSHQGDYLAVPSSPLQELSGTALLSFLSLMTLTLLKSTAQLFCRMFLYLGLSVTFYSYIGVVGLEGEDHRGGHLLITSQLGYLLPIWFSLSWNGACQGLPLSCFSSFSSSIRFHRSRKIWRENKARQAGSEMTLTISSDLLSEAKKGLKSTRQRCIRVGCETLKSWWCLCAETARGKGRSRGSLENRAMMFRWWKRRR